MSRAGNFDAKSALKQAADHQRNGQIQLAEQLIRQVLQIQPKNDQALHMLGIIAIQSGHAGDALTLFQQAITLNNQNAEYHCNLGIALLTQNRADEGEKSLHEALRLHPSHTSANFNYGLRMVQSGHYEEAVKHLSKSIKKASNPAALNALGVAYSKLGNLPKAEKTLRTALKQQPNSIECKFNLAGVLVERDKFDDAINIYQDLLNSQPPSPRLHFNFALALQRAKRNVEATRHYEHALKLNPEFINAQVNISNVLSRRGLFEKAKFYIEKAHKQRPDDVHILTNLVQILIKAGYNEDAIKVSRSLIALVPDNEDTHNFIIQEQQNDGDFESARTMAKTYLAEHPNSILILCSLTNDRAYTFSSEQIEYLTSLTHSKDTNNRTLTHIHFASAKIYHQLGNYPIAFKHLLTGNALVDKTYQWSNPDEKTCFIQLMKLLPQHFLTNTVDYGSQSEAPIFIVGMPRSGTTLVEQIIASHPQAAGCGELSEIAGFADTIAADMGTATPYPQCIENIPSEMAKSLASDYLDRLSVVSQTATRFTDKMPENYIHLGLIAILFPNARIIHCRRNSMATCFSIFQQKFMGFHPYAYSLEKLAHRHHAYEHLMAHWKDVLPLPILDVRYEDVVANQEAQSHKILEFCGLDWNDNVRDFHLAKRTVQTASLWQVRQPIYTTSIEGWRKYEEFLAPLKQALENGS